MQKPRDTMGNLPREPSMYLCTITKICRSWRAIAISTRGLWAQVSLGWSLEQCHTWIARLGPIQGLDLLGNHLLEYRHGLTEDSTSFRPISDALHRWRSIFLLRCSRNVVVRVFARINECEYTCDQLESIEIKRASHDLGSAFTDDQSVDEVLWRRLVTEGVGQEGKDLFPRLQNIIFWPGDFSLQGMLSNVKTLNLHIPSFESWESLRSVISQATALETLHLSAHRAIAPGPFSSLHLERLVTLDLGPGNHDTFIECCLHNLSAPMLRNLSISLTWRPLEAESRLAESFCDLVSIF